MNIIISPWSKKLRNEKENPKNYPFWGNIIWDLQKIGCVTTQIGCEGEQLIGANYIFLGNSLNKLEMLVNNCDAWISVDNFFPHFINSQCKNKRGVVIFSKSDPILFGYPQNVNLIKDREYLRPDQFNFWEECAYNKDSFVNHGTVVQAISQIIQKK